MAKSKDRQWVQLVVTPWGGEGEPEQVDPNYHRQIWVHEAAQIANLLCLAIYLGFLHDRLEIRHDRPQAGCTNEKI